MILSQSDCRHAREKIGLAGVTVLDLPIDAGIYQNPEEIGRVATLVLISLINDNDLGAARIPREILINGTWVTGQPRFRLYLRCKTFTVQLMSSFTLRNSFPMAQPCLCGREPRIVTRGFTLVEMLVVISIILVLMALLVPAFTGIKGGTDVTKAAYDVAGALETAATYARASNTYVWVGFFEEDPTVAATTPATAGVGRLVISIVYSNDGTQIIDPTASGNLIPSARLAQLGKLIKIQNMHFGDVPDPSSPDPKGAQTGWDPKGRASSVEAPNAESDKRLPAPTRNFRSSILSAAPPLWRNTLYQDHSIQSARRGGHEHEQHLALAGGRPSARARECG